MNFSKALEAAKEGLSISRLGWNGNGLFVKAQFPDENSKMGNPYLYIDATNLGGTLNPWVPSQTDLFAEDWFVPNSTEEPIIKETRDALEKASRPLIEYLAVNHHPHMKVIVDATHAELVEGQQMFTTQEYLRD